MTRSGIARLALCGALLLSACNRAPSVATNTNAPCLQAQTPEAAVTLLVDALRSDALETIPCRSVPPAMQDKLEQAWREDRSRWPLAELPLSTKLPVVLTALNGTGAETKLRLAFDRQFGGQTAQLQSAARGLGLFAVRYIQKESSYQPDQRAHYANLIVALSDWSSRAPLGDRTLGHQAITLLVEGAKTSSIHDDAGLHAAGMRGSLRGLTPLYRNAKQALALYGLSLDDVLSSVQARLKDQDGDHARVHVRYLVHGEAVESDIAVERRDGHWYLAGMLADAEVALAVPAAPAAPPAPPR
ncbi:hypothetical protein [Solilutibacter silvestris]|uniref:Lipoprotein n=1 Tax=Solilutibacter silvestris TaxID=1645665 RepID=A0A2K1Q0Q6_9GAMM|nr:hypothetical protein [Lysobacter silvestris]PNS08632.1 hypothetical protein Lysil_0261 [Lysobacter silvestris]